jgi:hypothetical protein
MLVIQGTLVDVGDGGLGGGDVCDQVWVVCAAGLGQMDLVAVPFGRVLDAVVQAQGQLQV